MKPVLFLMLMMSSSWTFAEEAKEEWNDTTLNENVIQKIQTAQYGYKKCVSEAMRKPEYAKLESRNATEVIIKECEPVLSDMRKVYVDSKVPDVVADRHLKKLRIQMTRNVLQEMMYAEAAKRAGVQP
ncbi:MAG: hypothetical protein ACXV7J_09670 [Methylomonas sp.]